MSGKLYSVEDVAWMFEDDNFDLVENVEDNKGHVVGNLIDNVTDKSILVRDSSPRFRAVTANDEEIMKLCMNDLWVINNQKK